ncbi:MAG: AAA family ATPase [Sphingobium sp.]|uniref:GumC family protein n=1 Tax=Sphingobium sp. TaxID=1912891 RepID=UPI0029B950CC|nr:AAA family ATPase [Sphingobium sp.]MDX3909291.1 AAA family ATPase [Sphingobium sp.]
MEISKQMTDYDGQLSDLLQTVRDVVRRRWLTLALVAAAVLGLGIVLMFMMTPKYATTARIRVDPAQSVAQNSGGATALNPEAIETEVAVLNSLDLARNVVRRLKLSNDPEFSAALANRPDAASLSRDDRDTMVAQALLGNLSVERDKLTYLIAVSFTSRDPVKSAQVANSFAEAYLDTRVGNNAGAAAKQSEQLKRQAAQLGAEVRAADAAVASYRARAGLTVSTDGGSNGGTIVDQQVAPLSNQLATAESDAAAARASLAAAQGQIARGGLDSVSEVRSSNVVAELRRQRAEVLRAVGEVQARYGEKHPEYVRVRDQLSSIDQQIKDEAERVIGSLRANATAADARAASLRASMGRLESERAVNTQASVMAESLEREAVAKRAAFDRASQLALESTQAAENRISQAVIVDRAQPPTKPTSPNKPLILALALVAALAAGSGTIAVQEMLVTGMQTVEELENQLGIPVLAAIPKVPKSVNPADLLLEKPTSLFAESLRIARAGILGVRTSTPPKVIAFTSALPSEGKTTTSLSFARTLASNNSRTLLLECDVRRAAMRALVSNPPAGPGIVEILHGEATAEQAIVPGDVPGLDHLLVRAPYFSSEDLFGADAMRNLLDQLRTRYDHIVLDLPPLVGLADGRFLSVLADATVLIVRWNGTPAAAAVSALGWLKSDGANPVGAIYTMVDSSAEAIGGLYYSKKYSAYYQQAS